MGRGPDGKADADQQPAYSFQATPEFYQRTRIDLMLTAKLFLRKITVGEWKLARKTFRKLFTILPFAKEYWWKQNRVSLIAFIFVPISLINPYLTQLAVDGPLMNRSTVLFLKYGLMMGA